MVRAAPTVASSPHTCVRAWRRWRPKRTAIVELVSKLEPGEYGPRDGIGQFTTAASSSSDEDDDDGELLELRTPRAGASFLSLGDFDGEVETSRAAVEAQLKAVASGGRGPSSSSTRRWAEVVWSNA